MAKLSGDKQYVVVEKGDTLSEIALEYLGSSSKYKTLATINGIENPDRIYVGEKIYLYSKTSPTTSTKTSSNCATIHRFGEVSNVDNTLFVTWKWGKEKETESYKVQWSYDTGDGVWFTNGNNTINVDADDRSTSRQHTYNIPSNAKRVRFKVKPVSKTKKDSKGNEKALWTASWSDVKKATWTKPAVVPDAPSTPTVEIENYTLTASLKNISIEGATGIKFAIVKKSKPNRIYKYSKVVDIVGTDATFSCSIDAGDEYKVCCQAYNKKNKTYSEWSDYSDYIETIPAAPSGITKIQGDSKTSVYLEWKASTAATSYEIQYTTEKRYFDTTSNETTTVTAEGTTKFYVTGLESGKEYFFRVRAKNSKGESGWTAVKSVVIGTTPEAPTTWSSTTTAIVGESLTLYWLHNSEDGSSETKAKLKLKYSDGTETIQEIENTNSDDDDYEASSYPINTSTYSEGETIEWSVQTAGATNEYGKWSDTRIVTIYAPVKQTLSVTMLSDGSDDNGDEDVTVTSFPFYIASTTEPNTQTPIGFHLTITSNEAYETTDRVGNPKFVSVGDPVYSKHFDQKIQNGLMVEMSAGNIDLENNVSYTVTSIVSMDSGLTNETKVGFTVSWDETSIEPNAEVTIHNDTLTASIRPYCHDVNTMIHTVTRSGTKYVKETTTLDKVYGEAVTRAKTTTGEQVYSGIYVTNIDGVDEDVQTLFCYVEEKTPITDVYLSVYRREFDGSFTEIISDLDGALGSTVIDPHPALDFARYRIVAVSKTTGTVSYFDPPGHPVGGTAVIIQWDEAWTSFETSDDDAPEQPAWTGSVLKLPYNIDVSDSHAPDVELVEYIGRAHPVSYYGTQLGATSTWNMEIEKDDEETLYALRRLARYMGDAYVREPSGSGYWANVVVSFNQTHCKPVIPVSLTITRVEGGV